MPAATRTRVVATALLAFAGAVGVAGTARTAGAVESGRPPEGAAVHVAIETIAIDRKGTRSAGGDEADLLPGTPGVVEKSITLSGRDRRRTEESVRVRARLTPEAVPPDGAACVLNVEIETRRVPAAPAASGRAGGAAPGGAPADAADRRSARITIASGEERLLEVYASPVNDGRVAMRVRCAPSQPESGGIPDVVTIDLSVEKDADGEPSEVLRSQRLLATMGREAAAVVTANATLPDAQDGSRRYRRTRIEAAVTPLIVVAGKLQIDVRLTGEIATVTPSGTTASYPIEAAETFIVRSGEPRSLEIPVTSGGPDEGWTRLKLTVGVTARY